MFGENWYRVVKKSHSGAERLNIKVSCYGRHRYHSRGLVRACRVTVSLKYGNQGGTTDRLFVPEIAFFAVSGIFVFRDKLKKEMIRK